MSEHILLIHMGTSKTGSSSIQQYLFDHGESLLEYGWKYPRLIMQNKGQWSTINGNALLPVPDKFILEKDADQRWKDNWNIIKTDLKQYNVIISSEEFDTHSPSHWLDIMKRIYSNIKVIIYLRRQDLLMESLYSEFIKSGQTTAKNIFEFMEEEKVQKYFNGHFLRRLDMIAEIIGPENLIVKSFDSERMKNGDVVEDFLREIIPNYHDTISVKKKVNERIGSKAIEFMNVFNSVCNPSMYYIDRPDYMKLFYDLSMELDIPGEKKGCFSPSQRKEFIKQFEDENSEILKKYVADKSVSLFSDTDMDMVAYQTILSAEGVEIVKYISVLYMALNRKINEMRGDRDTVKLLKQTIKQKAGDRKLIIFGVGKVGKEILSFDIIPDILVDNSPSQIGKILRGIKVQSAKVLEEINKEDYYILVTPLHHLEIIKQIRALGYKDEQDFMIIKKYFRN